MTALGKAVQYLSEGRVKVVSVGESEAVIEAKGSGQFPYTVSYEDGGWDCDCPARVECAHLVAAKLITDFGARPAQRTESGRLSLGERDPVIDALLNG